MASSWIDGLLGNIQNNGTALELEGSLNFKGGLKAVRNTASGTIDASLGTVSSPDELLVVDELSTQARQSTLSLADAATHTSTRAAIVNNRLIYVTWLVRLTISSVTHVAPYEAIYKRDGAGALTIISEQELTAPPTGITVSADTSADTLELDVANTTGGVVDVYTFSSAFTEDIT